MKHLKYLSLVFWLVLATGLILTLAGCNTPMTTPVPTALPAQNTPTTQTPATIRGMITYQAPPTPASMLYIISPEHWYSLEVPGASPSSTFEMQVAPGTYQLIAFPVGSEANEFRPAAAYTTGAGIGTLNSRSRTGGGRYPRAEYQLRQLRYIYFPRFAGRTLPGFGREL